MESHTDGFGMERAAEERAVDPDDGLQVLSMTECESRLRAGGVGILALAGEPAPVLRPVNFLWQQAVSQPGALILRTSAGRIAAAAEQGLPASFVISEIDRFEHEGWSVVVTGRLATGTDLGGSDGSGGLAKLPLRPWARGARDCFVVLQAEQISGRRIASGGTGA